MKLTLKSGQADIGLKLRIFFVTKTVLDWASLLHSDKWWCLFQSTGSGNKTNTLSALSSKWSAKTKGFIAL